MVRIVTLALVLSLTGCATVQLLQPTPTDIEITHADPMPANPSGEWDAVLVIVPEERLLGRAVPVEDAVSHAGEAETAVSGVLFIDTAYVETWLCGSIIDEDGPRCGAPALRVEGFEEVETEGWRFRSAGTVQWLENARLFGRIEHR